MLPNPAATGSIRTTPQGEAEETSMAEAHAIVSSIASSMTMLAAVELCVLEIIANKEKETGRAVTSSEIAAALKTDNPVAADMLERVLCLLATISVVSCSIEARRGKVFGMTPVGRWFVKDENGISMGPMLKMVNHKTYLESWYKLKDAVLEGGIPFNIAHGMNAFEYPATDPQFNQMFNEAMYNHTTLAMSRILQSYNGFENIHRLVDVGGGLGHNLKIILSKYPTIKGINLDLPHVVAHGIPHPGMEHVAGDMFEQVPTADVIFMKWILHDWDDDHCLKLLKNCHQSLPFNGKVIVVEAMVDEEPEYTPAARVKLQRDLIMMTQYPHGKERTKKEFLSLAEGAGFAGIRFEICVYGCWVMEFYK